MHPTAGYTYLLYQEDSRISFRGDADRSTVYCTSSTPRVCHYACVYLHTSRVCSYERMRDAELERVLSNSGPLLAGCVAGPELHTLGQGWCVYTRMFIRGGERCYPDPTDYRQLSILLLLVARQGLSKLYEYV